MKYLFRVMLILGCLLAVRMSVLGQPSQNISVSIEAHKRILVLGEPLYLTARVQNNDQQPLVLVYGNGPSYSLGQGLGRVMIAKRNEELHFWSDHLRPLEKVSPVIVTAGQGITNEYVILYSDPTGFAFPTAGYYRVSVEYLLKSGQFIQARPIEITIKEPTEEDARQWELLKKKPGYGILLQTPWDARVDSSMLSELTAIHDQVERSVYKQYLALAIGRYYMTGSRDNHKKAGAFLQEASVTADTDVMREKALRSINE